MVLLKIIIGLIFYDSILEKKETEIHIFFGRVNP